MWTRHLFEGWLSHYECSDVGVASPDALIPLTVYLKFNLLSSSDNLEVLLILKVNSNIFQLHLFQFAREGLKNAWFHSAEAEACDLCEYLC